MTLANNILSVPLEDGDTIGAYLSDLMCALLHEGESFSGKRPLGDSGWQYMLAEALVNSGFIENSEELTSQELTKKAMSLISCAFDEVFNHN